MAVSWISAADLARPTDPYAAAAAEAASWVLFKLSGQKYGGIRTTVEWYGHDHDECGCLRYLEEATLRAHSIITVPRAASIRNLRLRGNPVQSVEIVSVAGAELGDDEFHLVNDAYIIKSDRTMWDLDGGIEVSYTYGTMPPVMGRQAAIALGNQFLMLYNGSDDCALPDRVTSVSRQGVSLTVLDPQDFLEKGRTGIYEVDLFLSVANPSGAKKRARVFSPDKPRGERRR